MVVPTMWKYPPFLDFLSYIVKLDVIEEVIIVNNEPQSTPIHSVLTNNKVKMRTFGTNILVNPAWNYGVLVSVSNKICIMNDDVTFDLKLFYKVDEFFTEDMGNIGLSSGRTDIGQTPLTNGSIDFEPFKGQACYGWGNLMFVHKKNWVPIPDGLGIWFGDVWIFEHPLFNGRQNYFITNMFFHHQESTTVNSIEKEGIFEREQKVWDEVRQRIINKTMGM